LEVGAHLPLIPFGNGAPSLQLLRSYADAASRLGYRWLSANDHLVFRTPWLDGLTALASVLDASAQMRLATTVALPAVRGPVQTAKALAALDVLSGGRLVAGLGPGSSERDYVAGAVPIEERFARFEEAVKALRALFGRDGEPFVGRYYSTVDLVLEPRPARPGGPGIWLAGWGGARGLRRAALLGDGWLASAYNTTPEDFAASWSTVRAHVAARGGDPDTFENGIATFWTYVTADSREAERVLADVLVPLLGRPYEALRQLSLPIGPPEVCAERLGAFARAGARRAFLWPLGADPVEQLERFADRVAPLLPAAIASS
jgi:alkanesulfonate monooxygenase SsuD/methylene tetrahydromethanopterin reductase-like flavin-dependent oxidoreductase (luciferase family)